MATKKKIKTYGVRGLMEWVCNIPVGKSHMRIEFTGGVLTSYGNTPAKYVTKDLLQQTIIEHSEFFKKKRIVLLSVVDTDEDEDKLPKKADAPKPPKPVDTTEAPKPTEAAKHEPTTEQAGATEDEQSGDEDKGDEEDTPDADNGEDGERTADGKLIVKVTSLDDAKTYLNEKCGIAVRELRSRAKILDAAEANGVSFEGI